MGNNEKKMATIFDYVKFRNFCFNDDIDCCDCPFALRNNGYGLPCDELLMKKPQAYNDILITWIEGKGE